MKEKRLEYKIAVWLTMGLMVVNPLAIPFAYAESPIEIDRNAPYERQAQLGEAANGVTLVNITGPSAGGVSRNDYTKFNVPASGVILNNSYQMSNTQLAGYVPGNANMMRGSANVIVNEVTSLNPTMMKGFLEVAGHKASVVVANPNGITVDGGGFINTDRAILTTGKPEYDPKGNLNTFRVEQGTVKVEGKGLNAKGANSLEILTEAVNINAGVWADDSKLITGKNAIDVNTLEAETIGESNRVGLDVSAIGGMYANSITMKGSNTGLGVNVQGNLSSVYATSINADGTINVGGAVTSNGKTHIIAQGVSVVKDAIIQGDNGTIINSPGAVENHGLINSNGKTSISAALVDNKANGRIYGNTIAIKADTVVNHTDSAIEERYKTAFDALTKAKEALEAEWNTDITAYKTKKEMKAHRERIDALTKEYDAAKTAMDTVQAELDSHQSGTIAGREHTEISAKEITNTGDGLIYSGSTMNLTSGDALTNRGATIKSGGKLTIATAKLDNDNAAFGMKRVSDGIIIHPDKVRVEDIGHPEEGQTFDASEFPDLKDSSGYGVVHKVPVKQSDGTTKMVNKPGIPAVHRFTYIRSEEEHTHVDVTNDNPGIISAGGDVEINGATTNTNSQIISGGTVSFNGAYENKSDQTSDRVIETGTVEVTRTERVRKSHGIGHKRVRRWDGQIFTTPSVSEQNIQPIGTVQEHVEDVLSASTKRKVVDSLNPFGTGSGASSIGTHTIDGLKLPTSSLYKVNPDITANVLVETDPAFTNRRRFVSSEYMLNALANDPERRSKRLGDGYYEQELVNRQIVSVTGKQFLDGYTDNEAEYKALLEGGIAYGKQFNLAPGITLSDEQMKSITTDMVWLETKTIMVNGEPQEVLYPKVYLAKQHVKSIDAMGGVVSGREIFVNTTNSFTNSGSMNADAIVIRANTVNNEGRLNGGQVAIGATDTIRNVGNIHGERGVTLRANNDITVEAETKRLINQDVVGKQGTIGVSNGVLDIHSNKDVNLNGAVLHGGEGSTMSITAGNDVNLGIKKLSSTKDMTRNSDNYIRADRATELGTAILGDGDVTVAAKNDVNIHQGVVNSENGKTTIATGNDVNIENGEDYSRDQFALKYKEKGVLSRTVNIIRKDSEHRGVTASTIGGKTIDIASNHDVNVKGSNILGTEVVNIFAGNKVRTDSAEDMSRSESYEHSKKSGIFGAGIGFTIGSLKKTDTYDNQYISQVDTIIGSAKGKVNINANDKAHLTSTTLLANDDITISASDILLDGNVNKASSTETHERKTSGITVSLGGSVASAVNGAYALQQKAKGRNDKRLASLEYLESGKELRKGLNNLNEFRTYTPQKAISEGDALMSSGLEKWTEGEFGHELAKSSSLTDAQRQQIVDYSNGKLQAGAEEMSKGKMQVLDAGGSQEQYKAKKRAQKDSLANIHVSIGSSSSKSVTHSEIGSYAGGQLASNGKIKLVAISDKPANGTITAIGQVIDAKSVDIAADKDINLISGTNHSVKTETYDSKDWSVGANISVNGSGILGFDASYNQGMQRGNTEKTTHTGTSIKAESITISSGKDTNVIGSTLKANRIDATIGGDLQVKSLQDTERYVGESKSVGASISTNAIKLSNISGSFSKGNMKSDYASVTQQAGFFAGDDGFYIQTNGTTTLEGAVLDSMAMVDKNSLQTGSLELRDIQNKAEYSSSNRGVSYNHVAGFKKLSKEGQDAVYNTLGVLPKLLPDLTERAESTTTSAIANGRINIKDSKIDIQTISRNTQDSLHKLDTIFDKKKIEERQELARLFAKDAFEQLHYWEPKTDKDKAAKALAHGIVAELTARIAGNPAGSGFYAGATNEALIGEIQNIAKTNPAVAQWLSAGVGAMVNAASNQSIVTGAMIAQTGTQENAYGRMRQPDELGEFEYYYFIDLYGNTYKRTKHKDILIDPAEVNVLLVVQNSEKGHQLEGQEVIINSDRSWTAIDEPLGYVHPDVMFKTNWWRESKSDGERAEEFVKTIDSLEQQLNQPYVVDTWPDKATGLIYNQYNDGHVEFTGKYQGNVNLKSGAQAVFNKEYKTWYAGNYPIYLDFESQGIINAQRIHNGLQPMKDFINDPNTGIGVITDATSYIGEYSGFKYTGSAVTFAKTIPQLEKNQQRYSTIEGKFAAGVVDFGNEFSKDYMSAQAAALVSTTAIGARTISLIQKPTLSFTDGLIVTIGTGAVVSSTAGQVTDKATEETKKIIKEIEEKWKKTE